MSAKRWIVAILVATAVSVVVPNPALISTSPGASSDQNGEAIVLKSPCPWKQSAFAALQTRLSARLDELDTESLALCATLRGKGTGPI